MTTLREKRHRQCMVTIGRLAEQRELAFRRLAIVSDRLKDERARLKRLTKELPAKPAPTPSWRLREERLQAEALPTLYQKSDPNADLQAAAAEAKPFDDDPIPAFLKRDKADAKARAEIEEAKAEWKKAEARGRIAKMKAKQRGDLKRMPVTGRDALKVLKRLRDG